MTSTETTATLPEYRTWTGRNGEVRHYVNNTYELTSEAGRSGRESRRTWVDGEGRLHTDITLGRAVAALTAAITEHPAPAPAAARPMTDDQIHAYVTWMMDTEAQ